METNFSKQISFHRSKLGLRGLEGDAEVNLRDEGNLEGRKLIGAADKKKYKKVKLPLVVWRNMICRDGYSKVSFHYRSRNSLTNSTIDRLDQEISKIQNSNHNFQFIF